MGVSVVNLIKTAQHLSQHLCDLCIDCLTYCFDTFLL